MCSLIFYAGYDGSEIDRKIHYEPAFAFINIYPTNLFIDRRKEVKVTTLLLMNVVHQMKEMIISPLKWEFDSGITMIILCSPLYFL